MGVGCSYSPALTERFTRYTRPRIVTLEVPAGAENAAALAHHLHRLEGLCAGVS
jgi:hypothetical protein